MTRHRLLACSVAVLASGAFAACTFGADDFEIVDAGASTGSKAGSGGADGSGGSGTGGAGEGGEGGNPGTGGDGTGGAPDPSYLCTPDAAAFTIFSAAELDGFTLENEPIRVISTGKDSAVVAVHVLDRFTNNSAVWLRSVSDSGGGRANGYVTTGQPTDHFRVGAVVQRQGEVHVAVGGNEIREYVFTVLNDGDSLVPPGAPNTLPLPGECDPTTGSNGHVRNFVASYEGPLSYAVTCEEPAPAGEDPNAKVYSLHLVTSEGPGLPFVFMDPPFPSGVNDPNNVVFQYTKVGDPTNGFTHVMQVGADGPAPTAEFRIGKTATELNNSTGIALGRDLSFMPMRGLPDASGIVLFGAALTGNETELPIVPADMFVGFWTQADLAYDLPTTRVQTLTKIGDAYSINGLLMNGDIIYKSGVSFAPHDRIAYTLAKKDGTVLTTDAVVYEAPNKDINDKISGDIAKMGIGTIVTWAEGGEVKARLINCLPN